MKKLYQKIEVRITVDGKLYGATIRYSVPERMNKLTKLKQLRYSSDYLIKKMKKEGAT